MKHFFKSQAIACSTLSLLGLPLFAQGPDQCWNLKKHGDAGATACFERLTRAADAATQAEGHWGLRNYQAANDAFRAAVKSRDKDPKPRVRWGMLFLEHYQPADAAEQQRAEIERAGDQNDRWPGRDA